MRRSVGWLRGPWGSRAAALLVLLAVSAITWRRLPPTTRDTLWAEDATYFLSDQERYGLLHAIARPYAGYLHAVPRLLAALAVHVTDLEGLGRTVTALSCVTAGLVAAAIVLLSRPVVHSPVVRVLLGLSLALLPVAPVETAGNLANLHSYLLVLAPFLFLWTPRNRIGAALGAVVAALIAFTEIQTAYFLPLLLVDRRDRRRWPMAAAALAGVAAQVVTTLSEPRPRAPYPVSAAQVGFGYLTIPLPEAFSSRTALVASLSSHHRPAYVALAVLALAAVLVLTVVRCRGRQRVLALTLLYGSVVTWSAALLLNPRPRFTFLSWTALDYAELSLSRYATVSALLLVLALLVLADRLWQGRLTKVLAGVVVIGLCAGWVSGSPVRPLRESGPPVPPQVAALVARCRGATDATLTFLDAAPPSRHHSWNLPLTCGQVRELTR